LGFAPAIATTLDTTQNINKPGINRRRRIATPRGLTAEEYHRTFHGPYNFRLIGYLFQPNCKAARS